MGRSIRLPATAPISGPASVVARAVPQAWLLSQWAQLPTCLLLWPSWELGACKLASQALGQLRETFSLKMKQVAPSEMPGQTISMSNYPKKSMFPNINSPYPPITFPYQKLLRTCPTDRCVSSESTVNKVGRRSLRVFAGPSRSS